MSEPLSILHLLSYHLYTGPAEPALNLARAQRERGHDARLAFDTVREGDLLERAEEFRVPVDKRFALSVKSGPILLMRDLLALKRLWTEGSVDILHCHRSHDHTLAAMARPRKTTTRLVRTLHSESALGRNRDWQLRRADGLVTVARCFREQLAGRGVLDEERIVAIEGAVDSGRFRPGAGGAGVREEAGVADSAPVAGIVARMKPKRGHRLLLEAWEQVHRKLPEARLLIAGRGEEEQELRKLAAGGDWGESVVFLGYRQDLPDVYNAFDLKVMLAPGNDGTCRAALEAMASGVPVLASREGALPEIVTPGETGRLIDKNDTRQLAEVLTEMLSDRGRLEKMGRRARESVVERFTIARQVEVIERLYRLVLD